MAAAASRALCFSRLVCVSLDSSNLFVFARTCCIRKCLSLGGIKRPPLLAPALDTNHPPDEAVFMPIRRLVEDGAFLYKAAQPWLESIFLTTGPRTLASTRSDRSPSTPTIDPPRT